MFDIIGAALKNLKAFREALDWIYKPSSTLLSTEQLGDAMTNMSRQVYCSEPKKAQCQVYYYTTITSVQASKTQTNQSVPLWTACFEPTLHKL